jgi:hypothetical protein
MRAMALVAGGLIMALAGCAGRGPDGPVSGVAEAAQMQPEAGIAQAWTYRNPSMNPRSYSRVLIDPAQVYHGAEADFDDFSPAEVERFAQMLPDETRKALQGSYPIVSKPGPDVIRLRFTLVAVERTVPYAATATRIIPIGAVLNLGKAAAGEGGSLTGSLTILLEAFDSQTGKLLVASQRRVSPGAFDLQATLGTEETAMAVAKQVAAQVKQRFDAIRAGS